jgi:hypothetical protein
MEMVTCRRCGIDFPKKNNSSRICDPCQPDRKRELAHDAYLRRKAGITKYTPPPYHGKETPEVIEWKPRERPILVTDEEQARIDSAVSAKHTLQFQAIVYQRGTPEFDAIAAQITPLAKIRRDYLGYNPITAPLVDKPIYTRHETTGDL